MDFPAETDFLGRTIGPYVIRQRIGCGGMGVVYLAHDTALDRLVAIKIISDAYCRQPEVVNRFQREARAAAKLNHPNIVQVYAVDVATNPPYMVMEYVNGASVDQLLATQGPFSWQGALMICGQVASALACAHGQGIIHRDIKPGNMLVDSNGRVRVTDFGIAKVIGANTALTAARTTIGSPCYMSPEQCGVGEVVPSSDLFSLGITAYEMLTGTVPFKAETPLGLIKQITRDPLPRVDACKPEIPRVAQAFLEALTAKCPAKRYASAMFVIEDIRAMGAGQPPPHLMALRNKHAIVVSSPTPLAGDPVPASPWDGRSLANQVLAGTESFSTVPRHVVQRAAPWRLVAAVSGAILLAAALLTLFSVRQTAPARTPETGPGMSNSSEHQTRPEASGEPAPAPVAAAPAPAIPPALHQRPPWPPPPGAGMPPPHHSPGYPPYPPPPPTGSRGPMQY